MRTLAAVLLLGSTAAGACPGLEIREAWIREAPPGTPMTAAYATLTNRGAQTLQIDGAFGSLFGGAELHRSVVVDGVYRMTEQILELPPGATVRLEPGGWHLMLFRPAHPLKAGTQIPLALKCGRQAREALFTVRASQ